VEEEFSLAEAGDARSAALTLLRTLRGGVLGLALALLRAADEKRFLRETRVLREVVSSSSSDVSQADKLSRKMAVGGLRAVA